MAILTTRTDTETHECLVEINGVPLVMAIDSVNIYNMGSSTRPRYTFSFCMCEPDGDLRVSVSASQSATAKVSELAPDLYETPHADPTVVKAALVDWFKDVK